MRPIRRSALLVAVILGSAFAGCADTEPGIGSVFAPKVAPEIEASARRTIPHDAGAFTQGLLFHGGYLYESTGGRGDSSLRRVDPETGRVLQQVEIPDPYFAEGIAMLDGRIYLVTWQENTGFVFDPETLEELETFRFSGEGWGLTTDGTYLILSDGSNTLRFLDPADFSVARTLAVRDGEYAVQNLNELEWIRGEIWANLWNRDDIVRIDPETGRVIGWVDVSGIVPSARYERPEAVTNGIAYDPATDAIWVTGKLWPVMFEIAPVW